MDKEFKKISVEKSVHERLKKDRKLFGLKSIGDTIKRYIKEAGL